MKALSFGEILWDVYPDKKYLGGAPLNFAAHLARHGERVSMLSAVGQDELGLSALNQMRAWGVSCELVSQLSEKPTGQCLVTLDENSSPSYNLLSDVAYDYIPCDRLEGDFDVLYFGTLSLRSSYNCAGLEKLLDTHTFKEIFVDVNIRPPFYSEKTVKFALEKASVLKISLEELPAVAALCVISDTVDYKKTAGEISALYNNLKCIVITLGKDGAWALDCENNRDCFCDSEKTKVVSTVGAGDSFSAAFLHKYLGGSDLQPSLEYASRVAGFVVSSFDAVPDYNIKDFE